MKNYIRRVPGDDYLISCRYCQNLSFSVKFKGVSAILRHSDSDKHKQMSDIHKKNEDMGKYIEKGVDTQVTDAEISLARWAAVHTISLRSTVPHLVKTLKNCFPDSKICQDMGNMSASRMSYGLTNGLGKTEQEETIEDLNKLPFSLQMDGGMKGGSHRIDYLVRYYNEKTSQVVDKVIIAKTVNDENAKVVADVFLDYCSTNSINLEENLISINSDHASTLRGQKTGAIVRIAEKAGKVISTDIGGDILHDINNLTKPCFYETFPSLIKILDISNSDILGSVKKLNSFTAICSNLGLDTSKPKKWLRSRFLSRLECLKERRKRLTAYCEYYSKATVPTKRKAQKPSGNNYCPRSSEDTSDEFSDDPTEVDGRQPKAKKIKWMKNQLDGRFEETIVDMELAIDCIEPSHILLKVFQFQKPLIHLIKPTILGFAKESFQEITAVKFFNNLEISLVGPRLDGNYVVFPSY